MIDAAETEFATLGFEAATMDLIASAAGVSKSHLYYHFDSKDDPLAAIFAERVQQILADKDRLFAGERELDDALMEKAIKDGIALLIAAHPTFVRLVVLECFRPGGRADLALDVLRRVIDDTNARFAALRLTVDRDELSSALIWFVLLPILAELMIGADAARSLGLDPASQHTIFERQLAAVYRDLVSRLRSERQAQDEGAQRG